MGARGVGRGSVDLTQLERRLATAGAVREIMTSMRAISASQLRHGTGALEALRRHEQCLARALERAQWRASVRSEPQRVMLILLGNDQGLCGPLTRRLVEVASERVQTLQRRFAELVVVGHRATALCVAAGLEVHHQHRAPVSTRGVDDLVGELAEHFERALPDGTCDGVEVAYTHHTPNGAGEPSVLRVVPASPQLTAEQATSRLPPRGYTPMEEVVGALLMEWSYLALYRTVLESLTSEHEARLRTTDGAIHSLDERAEYLRLELNHARQEAITSEVQELLTGAEALHELD